MVAKSCRLVRTSCTSSQNAASLSICFNRIAQDRSIRSCRPSLTDQSQLFKILPRSGKVGRAMARSPRAQSASRRQRTDQCFPSSTHLTPLNLLCHLHPFLSSSITSNPRVSALCPASLLRFRSPCPTTSLNRGLRSATTTLGTGYGSLALPSSTALLPSCSTTCSPPCTSVSSATNDRSSGSTRDGT